MAKEFRKKPLTVKAVQFDGENFQEIIDFLGEGSIKHTICNPRTRQMFIRTLEGEACVSERDFVIHGVAGEHYPCKPDIFAATYEEVRDGQPLDAEGVGRHKTAGN